MSQASMWKSARLEGVDSLLPPCGAKELKLGHQASSKHLYLLRRLYILFRHLSEWSVCLLAGYSKGLLQFQTVIDKLEFISRVQARNALQHYRLKSKS